MRRGHQAALLVTMATIGSCVFPTERDSAVHVSLSPLFILARGSDTVASARAWQMTGAHDSVSIPNVVFVWTSSNPDIATVDAQGRIVGVKSGKVVLTAAAANFDKGALSAAETLRVAAPLEVDSVRPKTIQYGEMLSIYGVSVDSIISASLHGASLIRVPFVDTVYPNGTARSKWWVPPPARSDSLFFLGITGNSGVLGYVHGDTTTVLEHDLNEPNDTVPYTIDLDAPPPFAPYPAIVYYNPALAFEALKRPTVIGADWYRLQQATVRDLTVVLTAPEIKGTFFTFLTDSLVWNGTAFVGGPNAWSFGPRSHNCHGLSFAPGEALGDSTIVAFKNLPPGTLDMIAGYTTAGRYGLSAVAGYQSELPADAHEDDNSCNAADLRGVVTAPFRDTLAIENPHDVDWIRFHYTNGGALTTAQLRLHALPGSAHPDSLKDLDLYVIKVPLAGDPSPVQVLAADTSAGSDANLTPALATGDYYLAVVDYAGTTTTYEVCVGVVPLLGTAFCNTNFPAPPAGGGATAPAAKRSSAPRSRMAPGTP